MITTLVVEDEPPILRSICRKIQQTDASFDITHTFYNGQEAIDFLSMHGETVQVIFTDINMPIQTGLQLLDYINTNFPHIITVILSGYQDFNYARQAVQLGAFDYILKPLTSDPLKELLSKISLKLSNERFFKVERYFLDMLLSNPPISSSSLINQQSTFYVMSLCIGSFSSTPTQHSNLLHQYWEQIDITHLLTKNASSLSEFWIIPGNSPCKKSIIFSAMESCYISHLAQLIQQAFEPLGVPITIIFGDTPIPLTQVKSHYTLLQQELYRSLLFGCSQIINLANPIVPTEYFIPIYEENRLIHALEQNMLSSFKEELLNLNFIQQNMPLTQLNLESLLKHIISLCRKTNFINCSLCDIEIDLQEIINSHYTYSTLLEHLITIIADYHSSKNQVPHHDKSSLVEQIETFITNNFTTSITSQILSAQFGLVPSYISKLFKSYKGISPMEYIILLRIEKAKELLISDTSLKAKDIAQIVGYSDPLYFSRVFKKSTGLYPSEYKKTVKGTT